MTEPTFAQLVASQLTFYQNFQGWIPTGSVPIAFQEALLDGEKLPAYVYRNGIDFPANFAGSLFFVAGNAPIADLTLTIKAYNSNVVSTVGWITIHPDKSVTASTPGGVSFYAAGPGSIWVEGPNPAVAGLTNFSAELIGTADLG